MPYARRRRIPRRARKSRAVTTRRRRVPRRVRTYARPGRWINPIKQMGKFKLTFEDSTYALNLTTAGDYHDEYFFRGNSIYAPDYTQTSPAGKLPYGYNELMPGLFQLYKVYGSKIKIYATVKVPVGSSVSSAVVSVFPSLEGAPLGYPEIADVRRNPKVASKVLTVDAKSGTMVSSYASTKFMYPNMGGEFGLRSLYTSEPAYRWQWVVHGSSEREAAPAVISFDCRIVYYCVLTRRQGINESVVPT